MPFITIPQRDHIIKGQITWDDILTNFSIDMTQSLMPTGFSNPKKITGTITRFVSDENIPKDLLNKINFNGMLDRLDWWLETYRKVISLPADKKYSTFYIPKAKGGYRRIDAPTEEMKEASRELKKIFESDCGVLYHTAAFGFVQGRKTIDAVKKHQRNESKWMYQTDFHDFFGSTTKDYILKTFGMVFPFSELMKSERGKETIEECVDAIMLNGGLPQGNPISPYITNVVSIPMDHKLFNELNQKGFVYTRYADDTQISARFPFSEKKMTEYINSVLQSLDAPFRIKQEKTRYHSTAGRNWILGVMFNARGDITIGYKTKRNFKAMIHNFCMDHINHKKMDIPYLKYLLGTASYYTIVEKEFVEHVFQEFSDKHKFDVLQTIKDYIKGKI